MKRVETRLAEVWILETDAHEDHRGYLTESYNGKAFAEIGLHAPFVQDNHTYNPAAGTIRAFGYQAAPMAQTKVVRALTGAIYDIAVDVREHSPTFGEWCGAILSESNRRQLVVPKGFAHGYCTLVPHTHVLVKADEYHSPAHDRGILWSDPELRIPWPTSHPIVSEKDQRLPTLEQLRNQVTK